MTQVTLKDLKEDNGILNNVNTIYKEEQFVLLHNDVVMDSGSLDYFLSDFVYSTHMYDDCIIEVRRYDLHLHNNDKIDYSTDNKIAVSELLGEIKDKSIETILRQVIFSTDNKIDFAKAVESINKNRPEAIK